MNWLKAISDATSDERLLTLVNEYLLSVPDEHWSWIPRAARPSLVASTAEVHDWHRKLSDLMGSGSQPNIRLQDLCVFFLRASARAIELEAEARARCSNDGEKASREAG